MERRVYATGMKYWLDKKLIVTSAPTTYEDYTTSILPKQQIICFLVGDLQRIQIYPERGFQIHQDIPSDVWQTFEQPRAMGFTDRLIKE